MEEVRDAENNLTRKEMNIDRHVDRDSINITKAGGGVEHFQMKSLFLKLCKDCEACIV